MESRVVQLSNSGTSSCKCADSQAPIADENINVPTPTPNLTDPQGQPIYFNIVPRVPRVP